MGWEVLPSDTLTRQATDEFPAHPLQGGRDSFFFSFFDCGDGRDAPPLLLRRYPREALRGGIPGSFVEPLVRSWSHFVGIYRKN